MLENLAAIVMNDLELRLQTMRNYSRTEAAKAG
jgi:hypothetical protein